MKTKTDFKQICTHNEIKKMLTISGKYSTHREFRVFFLFFFLVVSKDYDYPSLSPHSIIILMSYSLLTYHNTVTIPPFNNYNNLIQLTDIP